MKLIKVVKYQRVRYGDLDNGDRYHADWAQTANKGDDKQKGMYYIPEDEKVQALDPNKYPPEVTYTIEGIEESRVAPLIGTIGATSMRLFIPHMDESEIETRFI